MQNSTHKRGFTLIETILFVAVSAVVVYAVAILQAAIVENDARTYAKVTTDSSAAHMMYILTDALRRADSVTEPAQGTASSELVLEFDDGELNPTRFFVEEGILYMEEGAAAPISLTSSDVEIRAIQFENRSAVPDFDSVHFEFDAAFRNEGRPVQEYHQTYYGGASEK